MALSDLLEKLQGALDNLVTLEIVTAVGPIAVPPNRDVDWTQAKVILTRIKLIEGDIETVFDPAFVTGEYQSLREFHGEREKQGMATIRENIKVLEELFNLATKWAG
jgi:hypothetical protein